MASSRGLGIGLVAGGAAVLLLMLVWLAVSGAESGGIVLGLLLALVLAGPLIGAGIFVLSRQQVERQAAAAFASHRRILESDRLFRDEVAGSLRRLAERPELRDLRLAEMADDLSAAFRRGAAWEDAVQLEDDSLDTLRRYDDLVRERVRLLRDGGSEALVRELRQALDQREDLLRGRRAPSVEPSVMLRSGEPRRGAAALAALRVGDAVSQDQTDYVADAVAEYFDAGQRWQLVKLVPTGDETPPRWLYVGPGGLEIGLLEETSPAGDESDSDPLGTAVVDIASRSGKAEGVLVKYSRRVDNSRLSLDERWPDGTKHAYTGPIVPAEDLDVWPAFTSQ